MLQATTRGSLTDPGALALFAISLSATSCGTTQAVGTGGTSSVSSTQASGTSGNATTAANGGATKASSSSTGTPFVCNPPADPSSFYATAATQLVDVNPTSMCAYRGDVLLIVDTAAE